jgi:hypothetical protein
MSRLTAIFSLVMACLIQPVLAEQPIVATNTDALARLERLEKMAAEQSQRLQKLEADIQSLPGPAPDQVRVAEVSRIVKELMQDAGFRDSLYPATIGAGYEPMRGFYIESADQAFVLNIKGVLQTRWTGAARQHDNPTLAGRQRRDDINAFDIQSLYLAFFGHIGDPRVKYWIAVDGGVKTIGPDGPDHGRWKTFLATIDYEYVPLQYITAGLFRLPFGANAMTFDPLQQMIERSLDTWDLTPDRSVGMIAHGTLFDRRMTYFAAMTNGIYDPDDSPSLGQTDTNFAYIARVCAYAFGKGDSLGELRFGYPEGDLMYSKDPTLRFGFSFFYDDNNGDQHNGSAPGLWAAIPESIRSGRGLGGTEVIPTIGTDIYSFGVDAQYKYRGFSVNLDYMLRVVESDSSYSPWELMTLKSGPTHQQGGHIQLGYFIVPKKVEVVGRLGGIWDNGSDNTWEYGVGANYYPFGSYNFRLAADIIRIDEVVGHGHWSPMYSTNDELTMVRLLLQVAF